MVVCMLIAPDPNLPSDNDTMDLIHHSGKHISPYRWLLNSNVTEHALYDLWKNEIGTLQWLPSMVYISSLLISRIVRSLNINENVWLWHNVFHSQIFLESKSYLKTNSSTSIMIKCVENIMCIWTWIWMKQMTLYRYM